MKPRGGALDSPSSVSLREITAETVRAVVGLSVADHQTGFVAPNAVSLAQALFAPQAWYRAVYAGEELAGFVMLEDESLLSPAPPRPQVGVWRFMIDARFQGRGIGRAALLEVIEHVRGKNRFASLELSFVPGPGCPEPFYLGLGFRHTGRMHGKEVVLELPLAADAAPAPLGPRAGTPVATVPKLFGLERSVYTRIARLALEEKGVPYDLEEVEIFGPEGVPPEHLGRHPFGRIPVLAHGTFMLYETGAITRYVDEAFPGDPLQPAGVEPRARMNQVIGVLDSYAYRPMVWGVFVQRIRVPRAGGTPDESLVASSLAASAACLDALEALRGGAAFLAGNALTLADLHAFPMLHCFCGAPEGLAALERCPGLYRWYRAMLERPSVVRLEETRA